MSIEELKDGDTVVIYGIGRDRLSRVKRVTATQIVLSSDNRYNRKRGCGVGQKGWDKTWIRPANEKDIERISRDRLISDLSAIQVSKLQKLSTHELRSIEYILNNPTTHVIND